MVISYKTDFDEQIVSFIMAVNEEINNSSLPFDKNGKSASKKSSRGVDLSTRSQDRSFFQYMKEIQKFPMLTQEEELEYGRRFAKNGDKEAAKILVQSHLRLVVKIASKFRRYGLPVFDLVAEGNLGLIQAVKKFDPDKGFRFATYAMWWIRAFIQDYILRSWSLVKIGTTLAQKKLFFNLHKIKKNLGFVDNSLAPDEVSQIAETLDVTSNEVEEMNSRLSQADISLNIVVGDEDSGEEIVDSIASNQEGQEEIAIYNQENRRREDLFKKAFAVLSDRERDILVKRQMSESPETLESLSHFYKVSRERIRQIEENSIKKIKKEIEKIKGQK